MKKSETKRGFTLIEIMVSLSIFMIVMTISMGAILGVFSANRKSQSLKAAMDNLNAAIETMSREARFGHEYYCGRPTPVPLNTTQDCNGTSVGDQIGFISQDNIETVYRLNAGKLEKSTDGVTFIPVTSNEVTIDSLAFYVFHTSTSDNQQPKIFMKMKGHAGTDARYKTNFDVQTLISQRSIDI